MSSLQPILLNFLAAQFNRALDSRGRIANEELRRRGPWFRTHADLYLMGVLVLRVATRALAKVKQGKEDLSVRLQCHARGLTLSRFGAHLGCVHQFVFAWLKERSLTGWAQDAVFQVQKIQRR